MQHGSSMLLGPLQVSFMDHSASLPVPSLQPIAHFVCPCDTPQEKTSLISPVPYQPLFFKVPSVLWPNIQIVVFSHQFMIVIRFVCKRPCWVNVEYQWLGQSWSRDFNSHFLTSHEFCSNNSSNVECKFTSLYLQLIPDAFIQKEMVNLTSQMTIVLFDVVRLEIVIGTAWKLPPQEFSVIALCQHCSWSHCFRLLLLGFWFFPWLGKRQLLRLLHPSLSEVSVDSYWKFSVQKLNYKKTECILR